MEVAKASLQGVGEFFVGGGHMALKGLGRVMRLVAVCRETGVVLASGGYIGLAHGDPQVLHLGVSEFDPCAHGLSVRRCRGGGATAGVCLGDAARDDEN